MSEWVQIDTDVVEIQNEHYIRATSSRADDRTRVLKDNDIFGVFDRFGDIHIVGPGEQGVFYCGTRFLSRFELRIGGKRPFLLSSEVNENNDLFIVNLSNPDLTNQGGVAIERGVLHIERSQFLCQRCFHERLVVHNYGTRTVTTDLGLRFDCDFADIFEVRGAVRDRRGTRMPTVPDHDSVTLIYQGLDGVERRGVLRFSHVPDELSTRAARFPVILDTHQTFTLDLTLACIVDNQRDEPATFDHALETLKLRVERRRRGTCRSVSSNTHFDRWICRSGADLGMMMTETATGPYPYAGVPWFSTIFGRDGIITALQCLWTNPGMAAAVLRTLAALQADRVDPTRDAQPGKILHERRDGEMATLGEIPFGLYYGSVDATPMFVWLAGEYLTYTGDRDLIYQLWPNIQRALRWIDEYGDVDNDGFVEYTRQTPGGLDQQGWKDSRDSVFHADGRLAEPPIALCEVQGYVYAAYRAAALMARGLGDEQQYQDWRARARKLARQFDQAFWDENLGTYVLALDGEKRPCRVVTSNAGHTLTTGIADDRRAAPLAYTLMSDALFCGWGIRTLAQRQARYNPMSYHNGSVWPHDNALIAAGLRRYGQVVPVLRLMTGIFEASTFFDSHRLPELFCGFSSRIGEGPTQYPVACSPQAWAAGAVYMLLSACLGLSIDGHSRTVKFSTPRLPPFIDSLRLLNLQVGTHAGVDLLLERHPHDVGVAVLRRRGPVRVVVER